MFNKNKDLILRITNGIFILWLVIALVLTVNSGITLQLLEDKMDYGQFKELGCSEYPIYEKMELPDEEACRVNYSVYERNYNDNLKGKKIYFYTTLCQIVFVSGTLFVINRKK